MVANRQNLVFNGRWMNAAGTLGFTPPAQWPLPDPPVAFVTNPISYRLRKPAHDRAFHVTPGGFLLHTGLPSPGFREVLRHNAQRWARSTFPVWVHLLGDTSAHIGVMIRQLEELEGVQAVEISFPHQASSDEILDLVRAAAVELPVILAVPVDRITESWLPLAVDQGAAAISFAPPRGKVLTREGVEIAGRLFGPAVLPLAAAAMDRLKRYGVPVIASGGVMQNNEIDWLIRLGAAAVQLDFILWRGWRDAGAH